jgi:hypothetical protein
MANPVWVQAESIDLDAHIRRIVLPKPGTQEQLEDCVGQLHSIPLDRTRPLWSVCIIEGLRSRQVGYYTNIHHAVLDGQAGVELAKAIFDLTPRPRRVTRVPDRPVGRGGEHPWPGALIAGALRHDAEQYANFVRQLPELARKLAAVRRAARSREPGSAPRATGSFAPKTPLNVSISAERGFAGVSIPDLLARVRLKPEAKAVIAHCYGGYTTNLLLSDFARPGNLVAHTYEGEPLPKEHGGPARLFVPHLYFWKSAKWVNGFEFVPKNAPGFWERYGYHLRGDPFSEERYS